MFHLHGAQDRLFGGALEQLRLQATPCGETGPPLDLWTPGATPNAHRAAWAHVAFNLITAVVALLLLPGLTAAVRLMGKLMALPPDAATQLALFHTLFNLLGVLLMWPLAERMVPGWQDCCVDSTIMSQPPRWSERAPG